MLAATDTNAQVMGTVIALACLGGFWLAATVIERYWSRRDVEGLNRLDELMQEELGKRAAADPIWEWSTISSRLESMLTTFFDELSQGELKLSAAFVNPDFLRAQTDDLEACSRKGERYATRIKRISRMVPLTIEEEGQSKLLHARVSCEFDFHLEKKGRQRPTRRMADRTDFPDCEMYVVLEAVTDNWRILTVLRYESAVDAILAAQKRTAKGTS